MASSKGYSKLTEADEELLNRKNNIDELVEEANEDDDKSTNTKHLTKTRKIILGVFLFLTLCVVAVLSVMVHKKEEWFYGTRVIRADRKFSLEEILGGEFSYSSYSLTWTSDSSYLHSENGLYIYNMDKSDTEAVLTGSEYSESRPSSHVLSPNQKWLMFSNNSRPLYRHSTYGDYYVKDLRLETERSNNEKPRIIKIVKPDDDKNEQIRYCGWANNGSALVFVYKCNIYYVSTLDTNERLKYFKLTDDGVPKKVFNGVPDWVYEEEIIASTHAIEFSGDGRYMSFVKFNATFVPYYKFPRYGPESNQYTNIEKIAYPKAGYPNPTIKMTIIDIADVLKYQQFSKYESKRIHPKPPMKIADSDYYYAVMRWSTGNELFVQWLNRAQNETVCILYDTTTATGKTVESHNTPKGWIDDDYVKPKFSKNGSYYITMLPKDDNRHLAKVSLKGDSKIEYLTEGSDFWVQDINCYDSQEEIVYFRSTEGSTRYRHVYSVDVNTKERKCISCGLIKDVDGTLCTYHYPQFSKQCSWVTLMCQGPFMPITYMVSVKRNQTVYSLTDNSAAKNRLLERDVPKNIYYTVQSDGFTIPVKETRPANFDPNKKYAILFDVYGGPNTQKVTDAYKLGFSEYFIAAHDMILINCDARGTGYNGYSFLHAVYKKLGYYEAVDVINVAKYLQQQSYIDPNRIAIWGWSYGGFYSATALAMSGGVIGTAVSVAPVTDWRYYDTVYSERYMGIPSPEDNLVGYQQTNVMSRAKDFRGKNFLLVHGTADDNVHFQNSAQLVSALVREKIKFRTQYYPDRDHSISSDGHIYYVIADFLLAHLSKDHVGISTNSTFGFHF